MKNLSKSFNTDNEINRYFDIMKEIVIKRISDTYFVGNVDFQVNIKDGKICNINIGEKKSIKI